MFTTLLNYTKDESYLERHPEIELITEDGLTKWEIFAICDMPICVDGFVYDDYVSFENLDDFHTFLAFCKRFSIVNTGVESPTMSTRILVLSTCFRQHDLDTRLVVLAKEK